MGQACQWPRVRPLSSSLLNNKSTKREATPAKATHTAASTGSNACTTDYASSRCNTIVVIISLFLPHGHATRAQPRSRVTSVSLTNNQTKTK